MRRVLVLVACAGLGFGVLGGCGSGSGSGSGSDKSSSGSVGGPSLEAVDNAFKPAQLTAAAGQKVTLVLKNDGATLHNFSVDALGVSKDVEMGKQVTISFTPTSAGTLSFYCKYHQALGMTGSITVSG
jgi:plastocyanin